MRLNQFCIVQLGTFRKKEKGTMFLRAVIVLRSRDKESMLRL